MAGLAQAGGQTWSPQSYAKNVRFVSDLGAEILAWAKPQDGESILDLGCGDGALTLKLLGSRRRIVAVDASSEMINAAMALGLDAKVMSGDALEFENEFNLVFSNAALHWMTTPDLVIQGVHKALRSKGRFVAEFGGAYNVAAIVTAMRAAADRFSGDPGLAHPWYFPTPAEHQIRLKGGGFEVKRISLHPRPTPLPTGMAAWLDVFRKPFFDQFPASQRDAVVEYVVDLLKPSLCDTQGQWSADYVRLRFEAIKL